MKRKKILLGTLALSFVMTSAVAFGSCDKTQDSGNSGQSGQSTQHAHVWGNWEVKTPATCTENGVQERVCSISKCYAEETKSIPALGHNYSDDRVCLNCGCDESLEFKKIEVEGNEGYEVVGIGSYTATNIVIPAEYNELPVISIGNCAFFNCDGLTTVEIPNSVTSIGKEAFYHCGGLTIVEIPDSVTSIGAKAFADCIGLTSVVIPNNVTSIGWGAFENCDSLSSITVPDSVITIGDFAFHNTEYYNTTSNWENEVLYIGKHLIDAKIEKSESYTIKTGTLTIADNAFLGCASLKDVVIPNSVTSIGDWAFINCSSLTSIEIPAGITSIGDKTFYDCVGLTTVKIPDSVTSIGNEAFSNCNKLTNIYISDVKAWCNISGLTNLMSLSSNAKKLYLNDMLATELVIPNTVTEIKDYTFSNFDSLTSVEIPDSVASIGERAFYNCYKLTSVEIGDSVTSIGEYAFDGCDGLTSVEIPDSVTLIGSSAFSGCTSLTSIKVSEGNNAYKDIDGNLYSKDGSVLIRYAIGKTATEFTIPSGVTSIGDVAFNGCARLQSIEIPSSVTSIGSSAFIGCYKLVEVVNKSSITVTKGASSNGYIGYYAFEIYNSEDVYENKFEDDNGYVVYTVVYTDGEDKILVGYKGTEVDLVLPEDITKIYQYAFYNCDSLKSVEIPDSVTSIGEGAFSECDSLTSVVIGKNVTTIGNSAFYNCTSLTSVVIPDKVTSVGDMAFYGCANLTSVVIGYKVASIGDAAFENCDSLTKVYYRGDSERWAKIKISSNNSKLNDDDTRYYFSKSEPTEKGNYWHYDTDGVTPIVWGKEE